MLVVLVPVVVVVVRVCAGGCVCMYRWRVVIGMWFRGWYGGRWSGPGLGVGSLRAGGAAGAVTGTRAPPIGEAAGCGIEAGAACSTGDIFVVATAAGVAAADAVTAACAGATASAGAGIVGRSHCVIFISKFM